MVIVDHNGRPFVPDDGDQPPKRDDCDHSAVVTFDSVAARGLDAHEIRKRWPRFYGTCTTCGFHGIIYASFEHYIAGDW